MELKLGQTKFDKLNSKLPSSMNLKKNIQLQKKGRTSGRGRYRARERETRGDQSGSLMEKPKLRESTLAKAHENPTPFTPLLRE